MEDKTIKVFFPSIHGDDSGKLIEIICFEAEELKGTIKTSSGIENVAAVNIIGASRHGENNSAAAKGVMATVSNPNFSGRSYGLALALADKLARYKRCTGFKRIIATGRIESDGCGMVSAIDDLDKKLSLVISNIGPGDLFIFPDQKLEDNSRYQSLLHTLSETGAKFRSISSIDQCQDLVWCGTSTNNRLLSVSQHPDLIRNGLIGLTILLIVGVLLLGSTLYREPKSTVESTGTQEDSMTEKENAETKSDKSEKNLTLAHRKNQGVQIPPSNENVDYLAKDVTGVNEQAWAEQSDESAATEAEKGIKSISIPTIAY